MVSSPDLLYLAAPPQPPPRRYAGPHPGLPEQDLGEHPSIHQQPAATDISPTRNSHGLTLNRGCGFIQSSSGSPFGNTMPADAAAAATMRLMGADYNNHHAIAKTASDAYDGHRWTASPLSTLVSPGADYEYDWLQCDERNLKDKFVPWYRRRRWITCLAVTGTLIWLLLIFLPVMFLVIIPKAIQSTLDSAELDFSSATITQPALNSFRLDAVIAISNGGTTDATLTYESPVIVAYNESQVFNLTLEPVAINGGSGQVVLNQTVLIYNASAWEVFNKDLVSMKSVCLNFKSVLSVFAVGQTFRNLHLDKTVAVQGFGGLSNVTLTDFNIQVPTTANGFIPIAAAITVFNPSVLNVHIGDILFTLSLTSGASIGTVTTQNVNLKQGANSLSVIGSVTGNPPLDSLQALFTDFLSGNGIQGVAIDVPGAPQWLKNAVVGLKLDLGAPGGVVNSSDLIKSIAFGDSGMAMAFTAAAPYAPQFSVGRVQAILNPQFKFNANFTAIDQSLTVSYQGRDMATINATKMPAFGSGTDGQLTTSLSSALQVISGQEPLFQSFLNTVFNGDASSSVDLGIRGTSNVYANTAAGAPVITSGDTSGLKLNVPLKINNPSTVTFSADAITLNLLAGGEVIGTLTIPDGTVLNPGSNAVPAQAVYNPQTPPAQTAGQSFLSSFISNNAVTVTAEGYKGSSNVASLDGVFSGLSFAQSLPSQGGQLLSGSRVNLDSIFPPALSITLYANNYYALPITISHVISTVSNSGGTMLATIDQDTNWVIAANAQSSASPKLNINPTADGILAFITSGGTVSATSKSNITAKLGGYGPVTFTTTENVRSSLF
ncbi:hypothetical protein SeMB42_g05412 [Synchytrium endobioticum]|uniref:Uncharacterized protein n=1 Tax=Synchytrium endobioticum TaxID=286115 RepID=A0A507CRT0_9FUNG|nr:hypothetical protein SeMB42_g05412 [Synchytrium endobioticum]TPX44945.1 hypothetical protein SeLEV6574_g04176 [Synchytrium endobioticum]